MILSLVNSVRAPMILIVASRRRLSDSNGPRQRDHISHMLPPFSA